MLNVLNTSVFLDAAIIALQTSEYFALFKYRQISNLLFISYHTTPLTKTCLIQIPENSL